MVLICSIRSICQSVKGPKRRAIALRPHRMSHLLSVPTSRDVVPQALLEAMATPLPALTRTFSSSGRSFTTSSPDSPSPSLFDLEHWISRYQLAVDDPVSWQGGKKWIFRACPWNAEHTDRSAYIIQRENGAIGAGCQHNSCQGKGWRELRALYEPVRERRGRTNFPSLTSEAEERDFPTFQNHPEIYMEFFF